MCEVLLRASTLLESLRGRVEMPLDLPSVLFPDALISCCLASFDLPPLAASASGPGALSTVVAHFLLGHPC